MSPQEQVAHYRITAKIGEGGMGEVWRATDTKLGREVAIKVLPAAFSGDADRMARFTREAQLLASLNHPNIAAIYGVEERSLVMELVDGPTLAEQIAQGPLPINEALPLARQIAEALEYAHERGIIHRDLKPANIKITPDERVKVLDFGLAKALSNEATAADPASSPTLTMRATMTGAIMGTAAYMSPEQAKGKPVDRRADIWAFGVVVYEMLTGVRMFGGETISGPTDAPNPGTPELFEQTPGYDYDPAFSPDGRWIAYASNTGGPLRVYVRPYTAGSTGGGKWQISTDPGHFPTWSHNGKQLFYETTDGHIMVVDYTVTAQSFNASRPRLWSSTPAQPAGPFQNFDIRPDGKRLIIMPALIAEKGQQAPLHATFLVNFFDEMKRRIP